jgi:DNA helicase IV
MRDRFREQARRILHADSTDEGRWLPALADWYRSVLETENVMRAAPVDLIQSIKTRLDAKQLTNVDINLLLAIAQIMSRGHEYLDSDQKRLVASLSAPRYFSSVFIDEVQDFYEIEVFLMASMANPDRAAVTVVGDFMQQLYAGTVKDLKACFPYAQQSELSPALLLDNKRQAKNLANFSSNLRHQIGDKMIKPQVVPDNIPELMKETLLESDMGARIGEIIARFPTTKSIAVISPTSELAQKVELDARPHVEAMFRETKFSTDNRDLVKRLYVHFTEPKPTKGLEFDVVIVTHFNKFNLADSLEAHGAYVAVSRPRECLVLLEAS